MVTPVKNPPANTGIPYLLADLDKITVQWSDALRDWGLEFNITDDHDERYSIQERYAPIDNIITIYDVCELLRPYFNLSDHPGLVGFDTLGLKSLANTRRVAVEITLSATTTINLGEYLVAYSNAPSGLQHTGSVATGGIGSRFLSRCNLLAVSSGHPGAVSWFGHGETLKVKLLHYVDGIPQLTDLAKVTEEEITAEDSCNMQTYNFTLEDLAELAQIDVKDIIYADMQLFLNSAPMDSVRFMHDTRHRAHERIFAFIGAMGEPEFVAMTGSEQREAEFEGVFLMEHNDYRKADTTLRCIHTAHTGALSEGERELLWDMAASPWVYVIENGELREVTITEVELTDSLPHREPTGFSVKWRYTTEKRQRTFSRTRNVPHIGIFDKTFDETFE